MLYHLFILVDAYWYCPRQTPKANMGLSRLDYLGTNPVSNMGLSLLDYFGTNPMSLLSTSPILPVR